MTDPIADMLIRLKNAGAVKKNYADIPYSKLKYEIAKILTENGFLKDFKRTKKGNEKLVRAHLKYKKNNKGSILGAKRISKPGQRIYRRSDEMKSVKSGYGISVISTSRGLMTGKEARKDNIGGEVLFEIW